MCKKKWVALLLSGCLLLQSWMGSSTQADGAKRIAAEKNVTEYTVAEKTEGALVVEVKPSLFVPFQGDVTVELSDDSKNFRETMKLDFSDTKTVSSSARFDVPQGTYQVCVSAERFADCKQEVQIEKGWISKIQVCPTRIVTPGGMDPGWLRPGDINGDKEIDQKDADVMLSHIREDEKNTDMDLNGDGKTDLVDLQNLVQSMDEKGESHVEKQGMPRKVQAKEGTSTEGSMEDFLNQKDSIGLRPSNTDAAISSENPVGLEFTLSESSTYEDTPRLQGMTIHAPEEMDQDGTVSNAITDGEAQIVYIDGNGNEKEQIFSLAAAGSDNTTQSLRSTESRRAAATVDASGAIVLDFGGQIAVKRVTIKITGTKKTEPLVNIAKVEFVNNMEERIGAPELDIPSLYEPTSQNEALTVSFSAQRNVTGYEIYISGPVKKQSDPETQIVSVSNTEHIISSIHDKPMVNFGEYTIKVRSVNGDWRSPWSEEKIGIPKPQKLPAPPDNVKAEGGYRSVSVTWKDMDDSNGYMVYYKKSSEEQFRPVVDGFEPAASGEGRLNENRYTITGLEDETEYSVYVIGWNELGWGKPSIVSLATTKSINPPELPKYKLLNTSNGEGVLSAHIVDATFGGSGGAKMVASPLDTSLGSALGLVDDNYASYWMKSDWDDGVAYPSLSKGMIITLDRDYAMNYMTFAAVDQKIASNTVRVGYWNTEHPNDEQIVNAHLIEKKDEHGNPFYIVKFDETVQAGKIHLCLGRSWGGAGDIVVGEIHFHTYDPLEDDIMGLYEDEMHTTLRADVTSGTITALEERLETVDEASGEKHPLYQELKLELKTAREILESKLDPSYVVDNRITAQKDKHLGFGGLNAWQPLGRVAYSGESLLVYVGHNTKRTGEAAGIQLVVTQHHAESSSLAKTIALKIGRNEITIPQITSSDYERGGQLYVAYTGNQASDQYAIRISGGSRIPVLSVYGKSESERKEAIQAYVKDLEDYVSTIPDVHEKEHAGTKNVDYEYNQANCILNATDIMMKEMMYSLPATQVWAGLKNAEDKAAKLDQALKAMENTMTLFYQHKGLSDQAGTARGNNAMPSQHLNIRYMRMFAGAFMYAAGNHIGIEWGSSTVASAPNSWSDLGWGIAHEIGHDINQGTYAVAEVTNNYFAQLLTKRPGYTRFTYPNVYKKVTSGTIGRSPNVFTQLALYWQLHLAFDNNPDDKHIFDDYEEQFNNLFFARVDTYSRNPSKAPQAGLTLDGGVDQNLMRLACAAANENILPFFERWGMEPDEATIQYAGKYGAADTKARYYVNDDARDYRVQHPGEEGTIKDKDAVTAHISTSSNRVEIEMKTDQDADLILGYEISRSMISNGKKETKVIGFQLLDTAQSTVYVDTISTINNRVMEYEVRAVDKYLNYSKTAAAGTAKIQTDGVLNKEDWTVETTMTSEDDAAVLPDDEDPDNGFDAENPGNVDEKKVHSIDRILDQDRTEEGAYNGESDGTAVITVDMRKTEQVTALKYAGQALAGVTVEVSADGTDWTVVKENYTGLTGAEEQIIWFDSVKEDKRDSWIGTYDARYVRLTISQAGKISIKEIDICGPSGDNLEFMTTDSSQPAIGILSADYQYGDGTQDVIPKGSLIFTGIYKGNPAYNVVVLYDTEGGVIGAKDGNVEAGQVIFADVPEQGNLGETSDGTWVYYVEPGQWNEDTLKQIGGVRGELYRVDDALTLEGERIVSDTQVIRIPDVLPDITFTGGAKRNAYVVKGGSDEE